MLKVNDLNFAKSKENWICFRAAPTPYDNTVSRIQTILLSIQLKSRLKLKFSMLVVQSAVFTPSLAAAAPVGSSISV